jgi:hypothetical protein
MVGWVYKATSKWGGPPCTMYNVQVQSHFLCSCDWAYISCSSLIFYLNLLVVSNTFFLSYLG